MDRYLKYKNTSIRYRDQGRGQTIIFLHGFLERLEMWDDFADKFSSNRIVRIDLLGHGESESIGYVHSMEKMAEYVKAVIDELKLRKYVLVGHSMGGYVALAYAERNPDNIKALCLFHSTSKADSQEKKLNRDRAIGLVKKNHKSFIRSAIPMLFRPKNRVLFRDKLNLAKKQALTTSKQGVIAALEGMKIRIDREDVLHFAPFKKLIIIGKYDSALDYESLLEQAKDRENVIASEFPIGHMGHIEDLEGTQKKLKEFIRSL